ncbi:autotransporter assembly complex family protein [Pseudoduganella sp. GCM10020061]|uniref:autotransporter assembly complex protein TamA n=1 Tax=Pseudoduganella sp. GCM10020061 TaxID=3317345 RepID=UPI003630409A
MTVAALLPAAGAFAQPVSYSVAIEAPGDIEELLRDNLDLVRWQGNARVDQEQLARLVRAAPAQARTLVETEGYYSAQITAQLDTGAAQPVARVRVEPGEPVRVADVDVALRGFTPSEGATPFDADALRAGWTLPPGRIFRQADWEAAKRNLLRQVMLTRYPRARLAASSATVDPDTRRATLAVTVDSGPEMRFDGLKIEGLSRYPASIIENLNPINPGDEYSEAQLQAFQARLQDTGYFSGVEVVADMSGVVEAEVEELEEGQRQPAPPVTSVPVIVRVTENKYKNVSVGLGFSTNTGYRSQLNYDDLDVYGLRMKSALTLESRRQTAMADFFLPTSARGYNDSFGTSIERNDLNGEVTTAATVALRRSWGTPLLERSLTLELMTEKKQVGDQVRSRSKSLPLMFSWTKRELDNLVLPSKGYVLNAQLGGAVLPILTDERFVRALVRGIYYRPLSPQSTLVLRGEFGALASRQKDGVPSAYLFRAGGDQSVRGYGYQDLGVREGEAIVGGRYLATGSAEYQYWFKPRWGAAVFVDAGNAADKLRDLKPEVGVGVGARWRSPVGPINVDVAYGEAAREVRLHFSLGFTF